MNQLKKMLQYKHLHRVFKSFRLLVAATTLFSMGISQNALSSAVGVQNTLIITETGQNTSFDPLDADGWSNMPVMRMLYATPFIIAPDASLTSQILQSFLYDPESKKMIWVLKPNLKYSDGSKLTALDVAFSIARFAFARPTFPVIEFIEGLSRWKEENSKFPGDKLPSGIRVHGDQIEIQFSRPIKHPFFRFSLEVFSIVPKSSVDLKTNQITKPAPFSGPYSLEEGSTGSLVFDLREGSGLANTGELPKKIEFKYTSPSEVESLLHGTNKNLVISGNELHYLPKSLENFAKIADIRFLQSSWFAVFVINPEVSIFKELACRTWFVQQFIESFKELYGNSIAQESSIFTKLLPGYMESDKLPKEPLSKEKGDECRLALLKHGFRWGVTRGAPNGIFQETMSHLLKKLGVGAAPLVVESREEEAKLFSSGGLSVFDSFTGFWPLDPAGDLKMLFTPKMHLPLRFVSEDQNLQKLIDQVQIDGSDSNYKAVNKYLSKGSVFNAYMHVRRFYIGSKSNTALQKIPLAIGSVVPWQVFPTTK